MSCGRPVEVGEVVRFEPCTLCLGTGFALCGHALCPPCPCCHGTGYVAVPDAD